tara:strand:+ start:350 stop:733 length:384 start_codon:yes stop_codon:yes gene_type:complete
MLKMKNTKTYKKLVDLSVQHLIEYKNNINNEVKLLRGVKLRTSDFELYTFRWSQFQECFQVINENDGTIEYIDTSDLHEFIKNFCEDTLVNFLLDVDMRFNNLQEPPYHYEINQIINTLHEDMRARA